MATDSQNAGKNSMDQPRKNRSGLGKWIALAVIILIAVIAVMNLPRGYSDDLSRIGKGKPAIVLVRDKNMVQSFDLIQILDNIRSDYSGRIDFLLTDSNTPEGSAFMSANNTPKVTLVLMDAGGKVAKVLFPPQTAESVRQEISNSLGIKP